MKRLLCLSLLSIFLYNSSISQIILPKFETRSKVERLSDEAEESNIFTYNKGENIFFYRTYVKGEGNEMEVLRQNIWYSSRKDGKWAKPDRLFRMKENEVENIIIGSSEDGMKVYIFKTTYYPTQDSLVRSIGMVRKNEKGDWSEFEKIEIPGLVLGENYYHFHLSHDEKILMISMSPNSELLDEDLFVSFKKDDGSWTEVKDLGSTINTRRVEISPYIDNDGRTLYFSSEGHEGFGGTDVFVSYRLDDSWTQWTKPKNLGSSINSKDYEENFVHTRNNEYYFTSNKDSESADIYYSASDFSVEINQGKGMVMKQNMPMPTDLAVMDDNNMVYDKIRVNTDGTFKFKIKEDIDNLSFSANEINAKGAFIYTLDKEGNKRERRIIGDDLKSYSEDKLEKDQKVVGSLQSNGEALTNADIDVFDINGYKLGRVGTDENGIFTFETSSLDQRLKFVPINQDSWEFNSIQLYDSENKFKDHLEVKDGEVDKSNKLSEEQLAKNTKTIAPTQPIVKDKDKVIAAKAPKKTAAKNMVYFDFNAISLDQDELKKLRSIANQLKDNSSQKVLLVGNTDGEGESKLNLIIGKKRALHVKRVLVKSGIVESRISIESKGESNPIGSNDSEEGRAKNRRVEIVVQ